MSDFFKAIKKGLTEGPLVSSFKPRHYDWSPMSTIRQQPSPFMLSDIVTGDGSEPVENPHTFKVRHHVGHEICPPVDDIDYVMAAEFSDNFAEFARRELYKLGRGLGLSGDVLSCAVEKNTATATATYTNERGPSRAKFMADLKAAQEAIKAAETPRELRFIEAEWMGVTEEWKKVYKRRGHMRQNKVVSKRRFIPSTDCYRLNPDFYGDGFQWIVGHPITIRKIKKILEDGGDWKPRNREREFWDCVRSTSLPNGATGA